MATKIPCKVYAEDDNGVDTIVYKEGPLFVWQGKNGWLVGHFNTGWGVCGDKRWTMKRDALAFLIQLLETEVDGRKINFDVGSTQVFRQVNEDDFVLKVWEKING